MSVQKREKEARLDETTLGGTNKRQIEKQGEKKRARENEILKQIVVSTRQRRDARQGESEILRK